MIFKTTFVSGIVLLGALVFKSMTPTSLSQNNTTVKEKATNVLGTALASCCTEPMTGYYRDGFCNTGYNDRGSHTVCAIMTQEFLDYTKSCGNDLCTPLPQYGFPGLKAGDKWCLCVSRWKQAYWEGKAPLVVLESTHQKALEIVTLEQLQEHEVKK